MPSGPQLFLPREPNTPLIIKEYVPYVHNIKAQYFKASSLVKGYWALGVHKAPTTRGLRAVICLFIGDFVGCRELR